MLIGWKCKQTNMAKRGVSVGVDENVGSKDTSTVESVKMLTELAADYAEYMQDNCLKEVLGFCVRTVTRDSTINHTCDATELVICNFLITTRVNAFVI